MEITVKVFEKAGRKNTQEALAAARKRAEELGEILSNVVDR